MRLDGRSGTSGCGDRSRVAYGGLGTVGLLTIPGGLPYERGMDAGPDMDDVGMTCAWNDAALGAGGGTATEVELRPPCRIDCRLFWNLKEGEEAGASAIGTAEPGGAGGKG
jgi:hypothetical protein